MTVMSTPIEQFKKEAKNLLRLVKANNAEASERVLRVLKDPIEISLMRIQHVIAVEHGFSKWEDLIKAPVVELHLVITMKKVPLLNDFGIGVYGGHRGLPKAERDAIFAKNRNVLRESVDSVSKTVEWLRAKIEPIKTLNTKHTSYGYKHLAEKDVGYITNGVFIAAAIIVGYPYKIDEGSPNVIFGMSERSVKEVTSGLRSNRSTSLGNFLRGPSSIPTHPHYDALADKFDKMTMEEQRRHLDEDARAMGVFRK